MKHCSEEKKIISVYSILSLMINMYVCTFKKNDFDERIAKLSKTTTLIKTFNICPIGTNNHNIQVHASHASKDSKVPRSYSALAVGCG